MLTEVASHGVHSLRAWRKANNLTLEDVAREIGRSAAQVSRYEKGSRELPYRLAQKISAITGGVVTVDALYAVILPPAASSSDGAHSPAPGGAGSLASDACPAVPLRGSRGRPLKITSAAGRKAALATREKRRRLAEAQP